MTVWVPCYIRKELFKICLWCLLVLSLDAQSDRVGVSIDEERELSGVLL